MKNSTSDLFINNCDEFIYYDDLVRPEPSKAQAAQSGTRISAAKPRPGDEPRAFARKGVRSGAGNPRSPRRGAGENEPIWGSMIKQAIKRLHPGFNERAYGFGSFNDLLEEAQKRGLLKLEPDEKSGGYTVRPAD